jgi:hypothetical protein
MPYIDEAYYNDEYKGKTAAAETLAVFLDRASDIIDQLTGYKIPNAGGIATYSDFIQTQIKKATAAQAEFLILSGDSSAANTGTAAAGLQNVNIGSFSYSRGAAPLSGASSGRTSPAVLEYLKPTGLLYMGLQVKPDYLPFYYGPEDLT